MKKVEWKDYLSYSKKERRGIAVLLLTIFIAMVLPWLLPSKSSALVIDKATEDKIALLSSDSTETSTNKDADIPEQINPVVGKQQQPVTSLFYFNPNTLDEAGWKKLGLNNKIIHTILKYRSKGGRFNHPQDIEKIYGFSNEDAVRIEPYIKLENINEPQQAKVVKPDTLVVTKKSNAVKIHINTATAEEWKALSGIGEVLSNRIVKFRNKLHGFSSIEEVGKTYGLPDSIFQTIKPLLLLE